MSVRGASANIWLRALRARFTGAWRTGRLGRPKRLFDDFRVVNTLARLTNVNLFGRAFFSEASRLLR